MEIRFYCATCGIYILPHKIIKETTVTQMELPPCKICIQKIIHDAVSHVMQEKLDGVKQCLTKK